MYDPKFSVKQMYSNYGSSFKSNTKTSNANKQAADSMRSAGVSGLGSRPTFNFNRDDDSSGADNNPNRDAMETRSTIDKLYDKAATLLRNFGANEPDDVIVDGKRVYQGPAFRGYDPTTRIGKFGADNNSNRDVSPTLPPSTMNIFGVNTDNPSLNMFGVRRSSFRTPDPITLPDAMDQDIPETSAALTGIPRGLAKAATVPAPPTTEEDYIIQVGDTLSEIAQDRGTTVEVLQEMNNIPDSKKDDIFAGDKLKVPPKLTPTQAALRRGFDRDKDTQGVETAFLGDFIRGLFEKEPVGGYDEIQPLITGGIMSRPVDAIEAAINERTNKFYNDIGTHAESDHGDTPVPTNDKAEKSKPVSKRSKDVGYGHKVKPSEEETGLIHGIPFKRRDGTYIPLTETQKRFILKKDMEAEVDLARKLSWDKKLKDKGTSWDNLDYKYKNVLTSLAFNVGGTKASAQWNKVLDAAKDEDPVAFARELRRMDTGKFTKGMDNRVMKELYYSGIISNRSEVSSVLPKANNASGVPR